MQFFFVLLSYYTKFFFGLYASCFCQENTWDRDKKENCSFCFWQGKYLIMYYLLYTSCAIYITLCIVLKIINIDNLYLTGCMVLFIPHVIGCHTKYVRDLSIFYWLVGWDYRNLFVSFLLKANHFTCWIWSNALHIYAIWD